MLSVGAFNALLKTLEEPPEHVLFILATTEIHKVPATILSRCQRFDFRRITPEDIARRLMQIAAEENIPLTEGGARLIGRLADGAMRDALSMLDRTVGCDVVDEQAVTQCIGILGSDDAVHLMNAVKTGDLSGAIAQIGKAYEAGRDLAGVFDQMLGLLRDMLLQKTATGDISTMLSPAYSQSQVKALCEGVAASTMIAWSKIVQDTLGRLKAAANRRVEAELTLVRLCTMGAEAYDNLAGRVEALEEKVKYGVPAAPAPDTQPQQAQKDAPPWDTQKESEAASPKAAEKEEMKSEPAPAANWGQWPKLLEMLTGKINMGALTCLKVSARAACDGNTVSIYAEDDVTAGLAKAEATKSKIEEAAAALLGGPVKVRIYGPGQKPKKQENSGVDALLQRAQSMDIEITEF